MQTDYVECIPDKNTLNSMVAAGIKFKLNGKKASVATILKYVDSHINSKTKSST